MKNTTIVERYHTRKEAIGNDDWIPADLNGIIFI